MNDNELFISKTRMFFAEGMAVCKIHGKHKYWRIHSSGSKKHTSGSKIYKNVRCMPCKRDYQRKRHQENKELKQ